MYSNISLPYRAEINNRLMAVFLFVSMVIHVVFMSLLLIIPAQSKKLQIPSVISVNMISLPVEQAGEFQEKTEDTEVFEDAPLITAENTEVQAAEPEPQPPVLAQEPDLQPETPPEPLAETMPPEPELQPALQTEPQPETIPDSKDQVVIQDAPEEKPAAENQKAENQKTDENEQLKNLPEKEIISKQKNPQTKKPEKIKSQVIDPENIKAESIKDAINRVRKKLANQTAGKSGTKTGSNPGGISGGPVNDIYKAQIAYQIEGNWAFSEQLLKKHSDLQALVAVKVLPSGHIEDVWFQKRSGDTYLDDSAYRAVMKSTPFPPLPRGYTESHTFILRFTPSGLN
ncbi:TonB/TolA C-terminal domain-containing protein [Desulfonema limicola]|uniref:TonB/TolA C-terminal domain-containing protein n=1 Tax=Desulfonema limicola TaxID=45656 RepID=A0A975B800_9BACT|nr:TonB family protein [Desulfonema limicola]QTA80508.1 TonB/TolA C-terminal domain-containing protein [Desulfonema limicola]